MLVYVLLRTVEIFAVRTWGPPLTKHFYERVTEEQKRAAAELGHDPTPQEFGEHVRRRPEAKQAQRRAHVLAGGDSGCRSRSRGARWLRWRRRFRSVALWSWRDSGPDVSWA
jgi:hypothetical protein